MTVSEERISTLETRVGQLETWAGPGQIEALLSGVRGIRSEMIVMRRVQDRHTRQLGELQADMDDLKTDMAEMKTDVAEMKTDVAVLKTDVAGLKTDVAGLKTGIGEILRRLPEPSASG